MPLEQVPGKYYMLEVHYDNPMRRKGKLINILQFNYCHIRYGLIKYKTCFLTVNEETENVLK